MHIVVTEKDIANGKPRACDECPIALAVRRLTGLSVLVGIWHIETWDPQNYTATHKRFELPQEACLFICLYDRGATLDPFEFDAG